VWLSAQICGSVDPRTRRPRTPPPAKRQVSERETRRNQCGYLGPGAAGGTMVNPQMVMYEEEFNQIQSVVDRLVKDANAKVVFIVDKNGQLIAASGDVDNLDTTSLASLTAGNIAATGGMAKLLKENEFATQFHEGEKANIHIQLVGNRVILVVIFDSKSSLGLVRLRVRKASEELNHIFEALLKKVSSPDAESPFAEITDEDIDNLFND
jgi:predicted regulator of Ras-like GTPase activity (Roadblock/LC7/MglB family)